MSEYLLRTARRMKESGNLAEAARMYGEVLRLDPQQFEALAGLGSLYYSAARFEEAAGFLGQAVAIDAASHEAWFTLGCALQRLYRTQDALGAYDQAIALKRDHAGALANRGVALLALMRPEDALASLDAALAADPNTAPAHINRGSALHTLGRNDEALAAFDRALALAPNSVEALIDRGSLLFALKRHDEAVADYERAYTLRPDVPYLAGNLAHYRLHACDWRHYASDKALIAKGIRGGRSVAQPFVATMLLSSPAEHLQCARIAIARDAPPPRQPLWRGERSAHDKIRIAYISADFREHAVARLIAGVLEAHDRSRFELIALSLLPSDDPMRVRMERSFARFHDLGRLSEAEAAALLLNEEIDIAVDLTGFTTGGRPAILAQRVAPVQVNFLGYPGTMGAAFYDYVLGDAIVTPPEHRAYYAEKIVTLQHAYQCNDASRAISERTPTRAEAGLPESGFVFCCFNNNSKISPETFDVWMKLLQQVPDSVLWLLQDSAIAARNLAREAEARGVAANRLIFAPRMKPADHLARHRLAGLFLDTLPYGAHTTASDALWAGLPVLTQLGSAFPGRVAASLLTAIGLPELIAHAAAEYQALALTFARDPSALAAVKAKLAANRLACPLFDTKRFTRNLEAAYTQMHERRGRGLAPDHFIVADPAP